MTRTEFEAKLANRAVELGLDTTPQLLERLHVYFQLLTSWNPKINLTAVNLDELPTDAVDRLFMEPLSAARFAPGTSRVIDIGSGGGSPAIPFALASGAAQLTMVESRSRKSVFLREASRAVAVPASVVTTRFEDAAQERSLRGAFDIVTVRAVRMEEEALRVLSDFMAPEGSIFLFQPLHNAMPVTQLLKPGGLHPLTPNACLQTLVKAPSQR